MGFKEISSLVSQGQKQPKFDSIRSSFVKKEKV